MMAEQGDRAVLHFLLSFVQELRSSGIPVSTGDLIDATTALQGVPLSDLRAVRGCLQTTLVRSVAHEAVFGLVFETYFVASGGPAAAGGGRAVGRPLSAETDEQVRERLRTALAQGDRPMLELVAVEAVERFAGLVPGRASGVGFHAVKALRSFDVEAMLDELADEDASRGTQMGALERLLVRETRADAHEFLVQAVQAEVRRRLVADRGPEAVSRTLRTPLPEDVKFLRASSDQLESVERALAPLGRRLTHRLARRQGHRASTRVHYPATRRASLAHGGVPADLVLRRGAPRRTDLVVLADVSGSVSSFAGFTLQLVLGLGATFGRVRTFAFVDGIAEVTGLLAASRDLSDAVRRLNQDAEIVWNDGHTDYGTALRFFWDESGRTLGHRTTVLVLGDARNNYRATEAGILRQVRRRAGALYWLNPEPRERWNTGDSVIAEYAGACDAVVECGSLRQLETFVSSLA